MRQYVIKRAVQGVAVIWAVITVVFVSIRLAPGNPVTTIVGPSASAETRQVVRESLGLDQPLHVQYVEWLGEVLRGDLGRSYLLDLPVTEVVAQSLQPTVSIAALALCLAILLGVPTGIVSAVRRETAFDYVSTLVAFLGISMPAFWISILVVVYVSSNIAWVPTFGYVSPSEEGVVDWLRHLILPSLAVALPNAGVIMRFTRSSMLDVLNQKYVRTAKAKGLSPRLVLFKHGLQNGLIPVVTVVGIIMGVLIAGTVAVEVVFGIRGMGQVLIDSIKQNDFPVVQGTVVLLSAWFVFVNLFVDILYTWVNPQVTYGGRE